MCVASLPGTMNFGSGHLMAATEEPYAARVMGELLDAAGTCGFVTEKNAPLILRAWWSPFWHPAP